MIPVVSARPSCSFCAILAGTVPAHVVHEDASVVAFLDHRPLFPGHVLVIPRDHHETLWDLPPALLAPVFGVARVVARALVEGLPCDGVFVANNNIVSQSVPHLHVHAIPRRRKDGLKGFFWPRVPYRDDAHARETAERIRAAVVRVRQAGGSSGGGPLPPASSA